MENTNEFDLVVAGAGPVGLTAALMGHRMGLKVLVLEKDGAPVKESRAIWIHPRTLEIWEHIGMTELALKEGRVSNSITVHRSGSAVSSLPYNGEGFSKYPHGLNLEQSRTQVLLLGLAEASGIPVLWNSVLEGFVDKGSHVLCNYSDASGSAVAKSTAYLLGADGGNSTVRRQLGVKLEGGTYDSSFFVADVSVATDLNPSHSGLSFSGASTIAALPLPGASRFRIVGNLLSQKGESTEAGYGRTLDLSEVRSLVANSGLPMTIDDIGWSSTYRSHYRVAETFRRGRVLLAGDAAHLHSPAGGLGLNTGVGDAHGAIAGILDAMSSDSETPLEGYSTQRRGVAQNVIKTSDSLFKLQADTRAFFVFVRNHILPRVFGWMGKTRAGQTAAFTMLSGTNIRYPVNSPGSRKKLGTLVLGKRIAAGLVPSLSLLRERSPMGHVLVYSGSPSSPLEIEAQALVSQQKMDFVRLSRTESDSLRLDESDWVVWIKRDDHVGWIGSKLTGLESLFRQEKQESSH